MKAVYDTNIFISALTLPGGSAEAALAAAAEGGVQLIISKPLIHEVLDVLARKFSRESEELARVAVFLADLGQLVEPKSRLNVLRDEPDNRILECAHAGRSDAIVTGDKAMLALGEYRGIPIMTLREFLTSIGDVA
ncbi:MAG TPA: putative toxin-antitoxin system toxin component, PIN family [Gammaproteobacteria bacterium]|nr:putative toxin-antitoxin system toxin component, PIN family [Gammaproteobacteria bacterium]